MANPSHLVQEIEAKMAAIFHKYQPLIKAHQAMLRALVSLGIVDQASAKLSRLTAEQVALGVGISQ